MAAKASGESAGGEEQGSPEVVSKEKEGKSYSKNKQ